MNDGNDYRDKQVLAGALLLYFSDQLRVASSNYLSTVGHNIFGDNSGRDSAQVDLSHSAEIRSKALGMLGVSGGHGADAGNERTRELLLSVCRLLSEFDHVRETMEG